MPYINSQYDIHVSIFVISENANTALLAARCNIQTLQDKVSVLKEQLAKTILENDGLRGQLKEQQDSLISKSSKPVTEECPLFVDLVAKSTIKKLFEYYTGYSYSTFLELFKILIPNTQDNPIDYGERKKACAKIPLQDQLFLVLCKLRNDLHIKDLAFRFNTTPPVVSTLVDGWVTYMGNFTVFGSAVSHLLRKNSENMDFQQDIKESTSELKSC